MNRMFAVFICTLRKNVRDRSSMLEMLLLPIVVILILGNALSSVFSYQEVEPTPIAYLNLDQGQIRGYFDEFIHSDDLKDLVTVKAVTSMEEGLKELDTDNVVALVSIDSNFSQRVLNGREAAVEITKNPENSIRVSVVENVVQSFINTANLTQVMISMGKTDIPVYGEGSMIVDRAVAASDIMPGAMDYYAVTMLVMMIMYGTMYSAFGMGESYIEAVGSRIRSTPIKPAEHYSGLVLGNVVTVYAQVLVLIAFTKYVYGVNWGSSMPVILLITFVLTWVAIGLGAMIVMLTRNNSLTAGILTLLIPVMTFIAGGYFKISFPGIMSAIRYISPNYLAQTAIFNTIYGGPTEQTVLTVCGLVFFAAVTFTVAMVAQRRTAK